jgi:hypothetical protein
LEIEIAHGNHRDKLKAISCQNHLLTVADLSHGFLQGRCRSVFGGQLHMDHNLSV